MISNLFSWENYDLLPNLKVVFKACTLKSDIFVQGQAVGWHVGYKIQEIEIDYLEGTIKFLENNEVIAEFIGELTIWKKI